MPHCAVSAPVQKEVAPHHAVACHLFNGASTRCPRRQAQGVLGLAPKPGVPLRHSQRDKRIGATFVDDPALVVNPIFDSDGLEKVS